MSKSVQQFPEQRIFDCFDWYWLADDGRVFASKRQLTVDANDADYQKFITAGAATQWPRDAAGQQTDAELQSVFDSYNIIGMPTVKVASDGGKASKNSSEHKASKSGGK